MNIRLAQRSDILPIQKIARESWHHTYRGIIPEKIQNDFLHRAYSKELLLKRFTQSYFFVAETDEQVVAFANFSYKNMRGESELGAIYIEPDFQGRHVGSELLEEGLNYLKPLKKLFVNVEKENHQGIAFYKAKGFQLVGDFEEFFFGYRLRTLKFVLVL